MRRFGKAWAVGALTVWPLSAVSADTPGVGSPDFVFSGFGTVGEVHSSDHSADFANSVLQPNGAGFTRNWSATVDSRIGGQLFARISPELSALVQVIFQQNYDGTFRPHVEWANIRYQITPTLSVRIGRFELPNFLFSDTRNVGFTLPWVRPPPEVYGLIPATASDGVGIAYRMVSSHLTNSTQASLVQETVQQPFGRGTLRARSSYNIANTTEYKSLTVRASYQHVRLTITSLDPFLDNFRMFGAQGVAIANRYDSDDKPASTEVVGASYDPGHLLLNAEWVHVRFDSFLGESAAWYASGGYRVGAVTPYLTYAYSSAKSNSDPGLPLTGLPPAAAGFAAGLNAGLNAILQGIRAQRTVSLGARWNVASNVDLKVQVDHTRVSASSDGNLINRQPGFMPGGRVNVFSATVDFVL